MRTSAAAEPANPHTPDTKDNHIRGILPACKERTKQMEKVHQLHDDKRKARGLGNGQHADEAEEAYEGWTEEEEQFLQLLSEWRKDTAFQSSPRVITSHSAYQKIIDIGKPALPFIFEDMRKNGGWWYPALRAITGANPVPRDARGNRTLNDEAWLRWGRDNGYA